MYFDQFAYEGHSLNHNGRNLGDKDLPTVGRSPQFCHSPMHIRFIKAEATYPLRLMVLRPGGIVEDTHFPNDRLEGAFHLAAQIHQQLISVASFYPEKNSALLGWKQYRLRGMATHPDFAGKGAGSLLIRFALDHLKAQHADLVWCNARLLAVPFYKNMGFETIGEQFDSEGIGPHYLMHRPV